MKKDYSYGIVPIFNNPNWEDEFLMINQKSNGGSFWGFPKWHSENLENGMSAAKRELLEEVWINSIKIDEDKTFEINYSFKEDWEETYKVAKYWIWYVNDKKVTIQKEELNWYKWLAWNDMLSLLTHNNTKTKIKEVFNKN